MTVEITFAVLLSVVSLGVTVYFNSKNGKRADTSDIEKRVEENTRMNTKLDMITANTQEIKSDIKNISDKVEEHGKQLVILEQSYKSLHKRIDNMENRLNKEGD